MSDTEGGQLVTGQSSDNAAAVVDSKVPPNRITGTLSTPGRMFRWSLRHNLDYLIVFHNDMQLFLKQKFKTDEVQQDSYQQTVLRLYDKMNAGTTLLLCLAYLEETLILCWRRQFPGAPLPEGQGITRYKPLLAALGLDLGALPCWATLRDAFLVRHCLLHANGRISMMRNEARLRECLERHKGGLEEQLDRVIVTSVFLQTCVEAIRDLRGRILERLPEPWASAPAPE